MIDIPNILDKIKTKSDAESALEKIDNFERQTEQNLEIAESERHDLLLYSDNDAVMKSDRRAAEIEIDKDRCQAWRTRAENRLKECKAATAQAEMDRWNGVAESATEEVAKILGQYQRRAEDMRAELVELLVQNEIIRRANSKLQEGSDPRRGKPDGANLIDYVKLPPAEIDGETIWSRGVGTIGAPSSTVEIIQTKNLVAARVDEIFANITGGA